MKRNYKYKAFLSYSHADQAWANRLHEALERYRVPRSLRRGTDAAAARIGAVFKDREELATSHDLGATIRRALAASEFLVVVASSRAAGSRWVNEEVREFLESRDPSHLILVVPPTEASPGVPTFDALRERGLEPIAADARADADGQARAVRKVIAGLLGVDFDRLQQRDRRRARQRTAIAAAVALSVAGSVAFFAVESRRSAQEAEAQRAQAAQLANFLVDDLAARLEEYEEVGTLDAGLARALAFFEPIDPAQMDDETLENYRTALTGVGSVRIRQGRPEEALAAFRRAETVSLEIANREQDNAERWDEQAQATYYIGEAYWEMQDVPSAAVHIERSVAYAERALELEPDSYEYRLGVVFGLNNLGAINARLKNWQKAENFSMRALELAREILGAETLSEERRIETLTQEAEAVSWLAEITQTLGRFDEAFRWHEREIELRHVLIEATGNVHHQARLADALGFHSKSLAAVGRLDDEARALEEAIAICRTLNRQDPDNVTWRIRLFNSQSLLGINLVERERPMEAQQLLQETEAGLRQIVDEQGTRAAEFQLAYILSSQSYLNRNQDRLRARELVESALDILAGPVQSEPVHPIALGYYVRAVIVASALDVMGGSAPNSEPLTRALELMDEPEPAQDSIFDIASYALLLAATANDAKAAPLISYLDSAGFQYGPYRQLLAIFRGQPSR